MKAKQLMFVCAGRSLWASILATALMLVFVDSALGEKVGPAMVRTVVEAWLRLDPSPLSEPLGGTVKSVEEFKNNQGEVVYYVAYLKPSGFVILPADDLVEPIIAFAARGRFDPSPANPLGALVRNDIPERVSWARLKAGGGSRQEARGKWQRLQQQTNGSTGSITINSLAVQKISDLRIAPLLTTLWDQQTTGNGAACYNYFTPPYGAGNPNNYVCGCVATALAQLLHYYQWPKTGVGTGAFNITVDGAGQIARLRGGDGRGGPYLWDSMPDDPAGGTLAQRQAIGALTYDAGVAVNMNYTAGSSAACLCDARNALANTFKFNRAVIAGGFSDTASIGPGLLNMVNPNLDGHFLVVFGIFGAGARHAVVCDGYGYNLLTLYHHLNLGWGGLGNAWYALPTIDAAGIHFTTINACIYNTFRVGNGEIISGRVLDANGAPLANAMISGTRTGGGTYSATADDTGIYVLAGVPSASKYALTANRQGYAPGTRNVSTGTSVDQGANAGNVWGANFSLIPTNALPLITSQPVEQSGVLGGTATFTVGVIGAAPLNFYWCKDETRLVDGVNVSGAATASLTLNNLTLAEAATYSVLVSNVYGSVVSTGANLAVYVPAAPFPVRFDDLPNGTNDFPVPGGYGSLNWNNFSALDALHTSRRPSGYQAGLLSSNNVAFNGYGDPASITSTGRFDLISAYLTAAWNDNLQLQTEGYAGGRLAYSNTYTLSPTAPTFVQFNYLGVQEVDFVSSGGTLHAGYTHDEPAEQFVMDNATIATYIDARCLPMFKTIAKKDASIQFAWQAVAGWRYQVQYTTDLLRTNWTDLGGTVTATNSTGVSSDIVPSESQRFYRVLLLP